MIEPTPQLSPVAGKVAEFGVGRASAVAIDASILRTVLVPGWAAW